MFKVIQPQTAADFAAYHQLRYQQLRQPWGQPMGSEVDEVEGQSVHRMIVDEEGRVVAVGRLHKTNCFSGQIRYMAVAEKYHGKGLGKLMLTSLEQVAIEQGVKTIELNAREVAVSFYQKMAYQLLAPAHTLYDEVKHFAMQKHLPAYSGEHLSWLTELKQVWHQTIPVSKHMLIHPASYNGEQFTVCADRAANINLHNTMFAGSIYTLATLTGWGWVHLLVKSEQLKGDIVLADADIRYHKPLHGQPMAKVCQDDTAGKINVLAKGRRARIQVQVNVHDGDRKVATFNGKYVVIPEVNHK
ncbi:bifunctional GNAT family N-acetyltransferase/hotdog fold thioesterase [Thalassotalea sp. ND16A]|uniref:bifunctional GNAT family N-acetyltransferase/hotdog fold thioesterase n=1 Tax=Thalassotalea sp. ND16A TaxID=1535422 RepID=UPI00051A4DDB|nr:bifunctional GNAT family N-acetyltransferase/hotdog fold thioesterase [Thalassotalea sp. ND16A]KGJ87893.1 hypothetical protein ND16A_2807 [Thalassotalea sp. ND16A]